MQNKTQIFKHQFGFNLIELLVAISIMGILFAAGYANYRDFSRRQVLQNMAKTVQGDLRLAQSTASSAKLPPDASCNTNGDLTGYFFNVLANNRYEIRASCSGGAVSTVSKVVTLTNGITIASPYPVPNPILFKVLGSGTNITAASTTITLVQSGTGDTASITISKEGKIQ